MSYQDDEEFKIGDEEEEDADLDLGLEDPIEEDDILADDLIEEDLIDDEEEESEFAGLDGDSAY